MTLGISKELVANSFPNSTIFSPYIVGYADYTTVLKDRHHQTGFIYTIEQIKPGIIGTFGFDKTSDDIAPERLNLFPFGGSYAD
jgi:hypothetical protein